MFAGRSTLWDDDTEFARQLIAGMNPCCLRAENDYAGWTAKSAIGNSTVGGLLDHASLEVNQLYSLLWHAIALRHIMGRHMTCASSAEAELT